MQCFGQTFGVFFDGSFCSLADGLCRIYRDTVSGVDTCSLNMLHDTRDHDVFAVAYRINLDFFTYQVFVDQDRMFLCDPVDDADILFHIFIVDRDLHTLTTQNVRRTNQNRITQFVGSFLSLFSGKYGLSLWSRDLALFQDLIEQLTVFGCIYIFCRCSEDRHTHLHQCLSQFDSGLSTELHHCSVRFLDIYNVFHIFRCQWLKIQFVSDIKVCTYSFRVVINNDSLIAFFCECPGTVYRAEVELDTLSDTDRAGTKYQNLFLVRCAFCFIFSAIYRVIIRCGGCKLSGTGIYHLVSCGDTVCFTHFFYRFFCLPVQFCNHIIREFHAFCFSQQIFVQFSGLQRIFHLGQDRDLIDKPQIDLGDLMDLLLRNSNTDRLCNSPDSHIIYNMKSFQHLFSGQIGKIVGHQAVYMLFQGTDGFHQRTFKVIADTHNFTGSFHLCGQSTFCTDKFIKWQTRDLDNTVV